MIKVVIVEDDYRIAGIHEEFLDKVSGFTVAGKVLNGKDAIKIVDSKYIDLVLLDIYMPDILGTDIIHEIRTINPNIDIITISAATETEIVGEVIRNGVFDYIIKPVKMERFVETVERYKKMKHKLESKEEVDQSFLDDYFGRKTEVSSNMKQTPKGIDPLTLDKVKQIIHRIEEGITAEEMGVQIGASRTTARRYLEYLTTVDNIAAKLEYGVVGRPERKYYIK
ncbi:CitB family two-component system response regulator CitT [Virgibacillus natechei]|uniref:CitB family two-component system response regulator CitT n=1 Tax=Virgibacillus natechei TaxID=1216297 RepID=A0ABS4IJH7_9BACI|nr:response regulator [Virgibacillus natechei]MBP1970730.1 CitB family two-component system response regulator CitT [Virgibacillus natechei]UZD12030.1 response regulator [Virgibacillus natechei]